MSKVYILDEHNQPIQVGMDEYARWRAGGRDVRRVARDVLGEPPDQVMVSTVFLGIDHGYGDKPILWETMVFGGPLDQDCMRYGSHEGAIAGHAVMLQRVKLAAQAHGEAALDLGGVDALDALADGEDNGR